MSENMVTLVGALTRDPELKFTNSGKPTVRFTLAVEHRWLNRQTQEWDKKASFFDVVVWDAFAENVANTMKKGYRAIVTGRLEQRSWEAEDGRKMSKVELIADAVGADLRFVTAELHRANAGAAASHTTMPTPADDEFPF